MSTAAVGKKKKRRKKINWFRVITLIIVAVLVIALSLSIHNVLTLRQEQKELKKTNKQLEEQKEAMQEELKHVNDKEYIEEQARKQLRLVKPGEILYILDDDDSSSSSSSSSDSSDSSGN